MTDRIPLDELTSDQLDNLYARLDHAEHELELANTNLQRVRAHNLSTLHDYHHALTDVYAMQRVRDVARQWGVIGEPPSTFPDMRAAIGEREPCRGRGNCHWMEPGGLEERLGRELAKIHRLLSWCAQLDEDFGNPDVEHPVAYNVRAQLKEPEDTT